jgi:hypothetical protein
MTEERHLTLTEQRIMHRAARRSLRIKEAPMSDKTDDALRETAWRTYQDRLGNLTSAQEAAIERAFKAGWAARRDIGVYVCPRCGARSYHPRDAAERYCGRCHLFGGEAMLEEPR